MDIKILFSDLDGTMVEHAGDVDENTVKAVENLTASGIKLIIASGRHPDMVKSIHKNLNIDTPVIGCNGGLIKDMNTKEILFINDLPKEIILKTIEIARKLDIDWMVYEQNSILYENDPPPSYRVAYDNEKLPQKLQANFVKVKSLDEVFKEEHVFIKTLFLFDRNPDMIDKGIELLNAVEGIDVLHSAKTYLDIMKSGTSKGAAVKKYLKLYNLNKEQVAAIGDAGNDIDMLEASGFGIAMGNAIESVKKVAKHISSKRPDGFIDAIKYLLSVI